MMSRKTFRSFNTTNILQASKSTTNFGDAAKPTDEPIKHIKDYIRACKHVQEIGNKPKIFNLGRFVSYVIPFVAIQDSIF